MEYLGHLVSREGVETLQEKVQAVQQCPIPWSVKALHGFLGLSEFDYCFIKGYASNVAPLTQILAKGHFNWSKDAQRVFNALMNVMSQAPILRLSDFTLPFVVEIDMSTVGIWAFLWQEGHPNAFFSKPFFPKLLYSFQYIPELAAITIAVKKCGNIYWVTISPSSLIIVVSRN